MRQCSVCEGILDDSHFEENSLVCRICSTRLNDIYKIEYSPATQHSVVESYIRLFIAIKNKAEQDEYRGYFLPLDTQFGGPLNAWRHNWIESKPWVTLWNVFLEESFEKEQMHGVDNGCTRAYEVVGRS